MSMTAHSKRMPFKFIIIEHTILCDLRSVLNFNTFKRHLSPLHVRNYNKIEILAKGTVNQFYGERRILIIRASSLSKFLLFYC